MRGLSERSLLIGDAASELASRRRGGARGGVVNGGFCMLPWDIPAPGARNANFMECPAIPGVLLRHPRRFSPESEDFLHNDFAIEVAAAAFSAILIGLIRQLGAAGGGLLEGSVGGRKIHFCSREFQFRTSLSRTDPVLNTMILV